MQPHMDMIRTDVALFSGETGIPVNALGIIHDNPASDAAISRRSSMMPAIRSLS